MGEWKEVWKVKNGHYSTTRFPDDDVIGWYIIASTTNPLDQIVLGSYCTEDDDCCFYQDKGKWLRYLQDEAVRLAEEKRLMPENTVISIVGNSFMEISGSVLWGEGK